MSQMKSSQILLQFALWKLPFLRNHFQFTNDFMDSGFYLHTFVSNICTSSFSQESQLLLILRWFLAFLSLIDVYADWIDLCLLFWSNLNNFRRKKIQQMVLERVFLSGKFEKYRFENSKYKQTTKFRIVSKQQSTNTNWTFNSLLKQIKMETILRKSAERDKRITKGQRNAKLTEPEYNCDCDKLTWLWWSKRMAAISRKQTDLHSSCIF